MWPKFLCPLCRGEYLGCALAWERVAVGNVFGCAVCGFGLRLRATLWVVMMGDERN
jgi:hypothetical protein